jgi:O-acetyl-ADP-ribose deacetylase (regulator of RNase III)
MYKLKIMNSLEILRKFTIPSTGTILFISSGSILDYSGDAIVNAANEGCVGGFGVDEQINIAGGYELKIERKKLGGCKTGNAKITQSFLHSKVKWIIHAVGPAYRLKFEMNKEDKENVEKYLKEKDKLLISAYKASLKISKEHSISKIGFCLLSTGVFRGIRDLKDILEISLLTLIENVYENLEEINIVAWTEDEQKLLVEIADVYFKSIF